MHTLETLPFDNSFARLPGNFHAPVAPTPLPDPFLVSFNAEAAALIDLDSEAGQQPAFLEMAAGNRLLPGMEAVAALYAGHQFGYFVPQLGDGRALLLGEVHGPQGHWELNLKGAGQTPWSRGADGRAVLRSSIREYLCSEAMHGLGIPTTRALSLVGSSQTVWREMPESAATVIRLAPTFIRFGSFEVFAARGQYDSVQTLADYVIQHDFPELADTPRPAAALLTEVTARTARLIAHWQAVGFSHGVLNTDNMSIVGLTLDYGPFGFMEAFDPDYICNHSDDHGRYAFNRQPGIGWWNLRCLAQALLSAITQEEALAALETYQPVLEAEYLRLMRAKLGLKTDREEDPALIMDWLALLAGNHMDYTLAHRSLAGFDSAEGAANTPLRDTFIDRAGFDEWAHRYGQRLRLEQSSDAERAAGMNQVNPLYILRNYLAETAIRKAAEGDFSEVNCLLALLRHPCTPQPGMDAYAAPPPDWARDIEVSCSS